MSHAKRDLEGFSVFRAVVRIPLDEVKQEWEKTNGPYHIQRLAEHYGIYRDLFPMAYFVPRVMLRVAYGDDSSVTVHYGNHLSPSQVRLPKQTFVSSMQFIKSH